MASYIERHISFGVDEFEGLWKLQFLHPFFAGDSKRIVTVYVVPPNSSYVESEYKGIEVVEAGPNLIQTIAQLLPTIVKYPYRWELNGKKLDSFGYDFETSMTKTGTTVGTIDLTEIAFAEVKRYYEFEEATMIPDIVIEDEQIIRDGALVKLGIKLEKAQSANQISFDFFTSYPIEIASIMYQEDTAKHSATYEIPLDKVQISASSLSITFPSVFAKYFVIILAQTTYTVTNTSSSSNQYSILQLEGSSKKGKASDPDGLNLLAHNASVYLDEAYDQLWMEDTIAFEKEKTERNAYASKKNKTPLLPEWRPEYTEYRDKASAQMESYEQQLKEYEKQESKYKKDMEEYVRYQQQVSDWYGKWGS